MEFKEIFPFQPKNYKVFTPRDAEELYHKMGEAGGGVFYKEERRLLKALRRYLADITGIKPKKLY